MSEPAPPHLDSNDVLDTTRALRVRFPAERIDVILDACRGPGGGLRGHLVYDVGREPFGIFLCANPDGAAVALREQALTPEIGHLRVERDPISADLSMTFREGAPPTPAPPIVDHPVVANLLELLVRWMQLAEDHGVTWWLDRRTLLGCYRDRRIIPRDLNVAVACLIDEIEILEQLDLDDERFQLYVHPGWRDRREARAYVADSEPPLRFVWPDARLIDKTTGRYLDIFSWQTHADGTLIDNTCPEHGGPHVVPRGWLFPLAQRRLHEITVPCPARTRRVLEAYYGPALHPPRRDGA